jgi:hypothetical protein
MHAYCEDHVARRGERTYIHRHLSNITFKLVNKLSETSGLLRIDEEEDYSFPYPSIICHSTNSLDICLLLCHAMIMMTMSGIHNLSLEEEGKRTLWIDDECVSGWKEDAFSLLPTLGVRGKS